MKSKTIAEANRRNAARSTGPRTAKGRSRSAQNARRHGFASAVVDGTKLSEEAEKLARAVAGPDPSPQRLYYARIIAETQFTLARMRIPVHRGQSFRRIADSNPVIADSR